MNNCKRTAVDTRNFAQ